MRTTTIFPEFGNQNEFRTYPFSDAASLTSVNGERIPNNIIADIIIHPPDDGLSGVVFVSSIDFANGEIVFRFSGTQQVIGTAKFTDASTWVEIIGPGNVGVIGIVDFGPGLADAYNFGSSQHVFKAHATELVPSVVFPVTTGGVTGIELPDGTVLTGDITIKGGKGVEVSSVGLGIMGRIRVDCFGEPPTVNAIKAIRVTGSADSLFIPYKYAPTVLSLTSRYDLANFKKDSTGGTIDAVRDAYEPCDDPPEPTIAPVGAAVSYIFYINGSTFSMATPSSLDYMNPVFLRLFESPAPLDTTAEFLTPATAADIMRDYTLPPAPGGGIIIEFAGMPGSGYGDKL